MAIPPDVVGKAASTAATAANNVAGAQANPQSHWYDVWTRTGSGLMSNVPDPQYDATHAVPLAGIVDSRLQMAQAMGRDWNSTSWDDLKNGMNQQADSIANQVQNLFHTGDNPAAFPRGVLAHIGAAFGLLTSLEQLITMPLGMIPFPAFPALRVLDTDIGLPHAHNHPPNLVPPAPPVPLPSTGPIIPIPFVSGAARVLINGMPAARCGDMGLGIWCGGYFPLYEVFLGSANVWIEGSRAGRVGVDITKHCIFSAKKPSDPPMGPMFGSTINCSPNVMIGGAPLPSLTSLAMRAAFKQLFKGLGKLAGWARGKLGRGAGAAGHAPPSPRSRGGQPPGPRIPPPHGNVPAIHSPQAQNIARNFGPGDRILINSINAGELRAITEMTGRECAVVVNQNGKLTLVMGTADHVALEAGDHLLVHTHPPGVVAYPSGTNGDLGNAAYNQSTYGWDHPQAVIGQDGNIRYYDQNGVIQNPNSQYLPISNDGTINGVHHRGGDPNMPMSAIPPGISTPGNPYRP